VADEVTAAYNDAAHSESLRIGSERMTKKLELASVSDIVSWLEQVGLVNVATCFAACGANGRTLLALHSWRGVDLRYVAAILVRFRYAAG
jgi:hypothetical protein